MKKSGIITAFFLFSLVTVFSEQDDVRCHLHQGDEAYRKGLSALSSGEQGGDELFHESALHYIAALEKGASGWVVHYNAANAFYRSGDNARAILYYRKALLYGWHKGEIWNNLMIARKGVSSNYFYGGLGQKISIFLRSFLYGRITAVLFVSGWVCFWLALSAGRKRKKALGLVPVFAFIMAAAVMLSIPFSLQFVTPSGVIIKDVAGYTGDSDGYDKSHTGPFVSGTEIRVVKVYDDWIHIRLPDGSDSWVVKDAIELIR